MIMWIGIFSAICHNCWLQECIYFIPFFVLVMALLPKYLKLLSAFGKVIPFLFSYLLLWRRPSREVRELGVINSFEVKTG